MSVFYYIFLHLKYDIGKMLYMPHSLFRTYYENCLLTFKKMIKRKTFFMGKLQFLINLSMFFPSFYSWRKVQKHDFCCRRIRWNGERVQVVMVSCHGYILHNFLYFNNRLHCRRKTSFCQNIYCFNTKNL